MKTYDRICPVCGRLNRKLYLEETEGFMECERCGIISKGCVDRTDMVTAAAMNSEWDWKSVLTTAPEQGQLIQPAARVFQMAGSPV